MAWGVAICALLLVVSSPSPALSFCVVPRGQNIATYRGRGGRSRRGTTGSKKRRRAQSCASRIREVVLRRHASSSSGDGDDGVSSHNRASAKKSRRRGYPIPVIGPIPNAQPLLPGDDMILDPPTPLQWKGLGESVVVHRNFLQQQQDDGDGDGGGGVDSSSSSTATAGIIDAAPLVAVIDDVTGVIPVGTPGSSNAGERGRYATIAAVVGICSKGEQTETSFEEYIVQCSVADDMISPLSSTVRLVAVGRAALRDFFYKMPATIIAQRQDDDGGEGAPTGTTDGAAATAALRYDDWDEHNEEDDEDEEEWDDGYAESTPIVMAEFTAVRDANTLNYGTADKVGEKGARSARMSPVHAMAELHRVSNQVVWMHNERRRLGAGMSAAAARLALRERKARWAGEDAAAAAARGEFIDDYYDDGIGLTNSGFSTSVAQGEDDTDDVMSVEELIIRFQKKTPPEAEDKGDTQEMSTPPVTEGVNSLSRIAQMENYGLNYYSYFSSIPDLTAVALRTFEPYYSREYRETEEHALQVLSFVAFRALVGYAEPIDIAWALQCQSTVERMQRAYDLMLQHRRDLECLAEGISRELTECGEECTDLW